MLYSREQECELLFGRMKPVYNANTPENHPLIFRSEEDFKAGMSILAICARMHPDVTVYAFQLMSNHFHLVVGGDSRRIQVFFRYFAVRLSKFFEDSFDPNELTLKLFPVNDLSYMRNAIAYVNRNGFVVNNDVTPFSYPWGSSSFFFQPVALRYAEFSGKPIGVRVLRGLTHSRYCDSLGNIKAIDGYISPLEFCDIQSSERLFRDAKQYFYLISRNVETYSEIAKSIGESIYFNDYDLRVASLRYSMEHFGVKDLVSLNVEEKIELAKRLHYDYNANEKQIQRLLKIDSVILKALSL